MKSKWSLAGWALILGCGVTFFRRGISPESIGYALLIAAAIFGIGLLIDWVFNLFSKPEASETKQDTAAASPGPPPPPTTTPVPPGAVTEHPLNLPPIPLDPKAAKLAPPPAPIAAKKDDEIKDSFRELIETVVFVVVLVLMLKTFLAEAFVIPTGSMATTLLGYHYKVTCPQCGYPNLVNASAEAEPPNQQNPPRLHRWQCINCKLNVLKDRPDRGAP